MMAALRAVVSDLAAVLVDGARAAVFLPRREIREPSSTIVIALLILLDVAALVVVGRASETGAVVFDPSGFQGVLVQAGVLAFSSAVLLTFSGKSRLSAVFSLALAASLVIDIIWNALWLWSATGPWFDQHLPQSFAVWDVSQGWLGLALGGALLRAARGWPRKIAAFVICLVVVSGPLLIIDRGAGFWTEPVQPEAQAPVSDVASEELLYDENGRLDSALGSLLPRTPGRINVYFVGFAGNGSQDVFMREVIYVKDLFDKRFRAAGHSVALINNPATADAVPLATITSLHDTLAEVGTRMTDEDILVLFLTSHGSAENGVNIALKPFSFDDLDPATLKQMLDDAHIRQRVVIVSACYAGVFVKPLAGPNTLVITAADATHTSFGCSNEADFTYFGRAYFADGLAHTTSLTEAFRIAEPIIKAREDGDGYAHSNPQMVAGAAIEASLEKLQAQLKSSKP